MLICIIILIIQLSIFISHNGHLIVWFRSTIRIVLSATDSFFFNLVQLKKHPIYWNRWGWRCGLASELYWIGMNCSLIWTGIWHMLWVCHFSLWPCPHMRHVHITDRKVANYNYFIKKMQSASLMARQRMATCRKVPRKRKRCSDACCCEHSCRVPRWNSTGSSTSVQCRKHAWRKTATPL